MATNPMQRKAKISFLLGILVTLLITGAVIALLLLQLKNYRDKEAQEQANKTTVYVLTQDVKSGDIITSNMITQLSVNKTLVPSNAIADMQILTNYSLRDKDGNEIISETKNNITTLYISKNNNKYEVFKDVENDEYYIERNGERENVELIEDALIAKIDMNKNSVITIDSIEKTNEKTTDDLRKQEYNLLVLPTQLETGDYIDVRLALTTGEDYIVISKKQVEIPQINGIDSEDTIWIKLTEEEIITMNNAIVDAYRMLGAKLYVTTYTEAGIQKAATPTYVPTAETMRLIENNPNIINRAKNELIERYNENSSRVRNDSINSAINNSGEEGQENLKTKINEGITNSKESRKEYLESLGGDY